MTFWLWFLVALGGWVLANAVLVAALLALESWLDHCEAKRLKRVGWTDDTSHRANGDFTLAPDLAKQRPARVIRQATAYHRLLDR